MFLLIHAAFKYGIVQIAVIHHKIHPSVLQKLLQTRSAFLHKRDLHHGVFSGKPAHDLGQDPGRKKTAASQSEISGLQFPQIINIMKELLLRSHHFFHSGNIFFAAFRKLQRLCAPVKDRIADPFLRPFYSRAEGRLGNKQLLGGAGEAFFPVNCINIFSALKHPGIVFRHFHPPLLLL